MQSEPTGYVTGFRRRLYRIFGWASLGMAVVGAVTPGIPAVPFVLLGSYFFIRSSPKTHAWLLRSRYFGGILRDWEERRGVSQSVKLTALALIGIGVVFTVLTNLPLELVAAILAMEAIGMIIVLRLRVVEGTEMATRAVENWVTPSYRAVFRRSVIPPLFRADGTTCIRYSGSR